MSHHFDTEQAKNDPRLNICDMYLFSQEPGRTVMIMTINADTGLSSPDVFHPEAIYNFRFDTDSDLKADVVFKLRFGEPRHATDDHDQHLQDFTLFRATGDQTGIQGEVLLRGSTGLVAEAAGVKVYAGVVPELWASDAKAFQSALVGVLTEGRFRLEAFDNHENKFAKRNVTAIVVEIPDGFLSARKLRMWGTISLFGHAPEVQVYRYGLPLFTHLFLVNPDTPGMATQYHSSEPTDDARVFRPVVEALAAKIARAAGAAADPDAAASEIADRFCPDLMPYELGTPAAFSIERFNGRRLEDDAYDVVWSLVSGLSVQDGVAPPRDRLVASFPYYGLPYTRLEQLGLAPVVSAIGYDPAAGAHP